MFDAKAIEESLGKNALALSIVLSTVYGIFGLLATKDIQLATIIAAFSGFCFSVVDLLNKVESFSEIDWPVIKIGLSGLIFSCVVFFIAICYMESNDYKKKKS